MAQLYRLLARAQMDGAIREPGYLFYLPLDGEGNEVLGPHKTVEHGSDYNDLNPSSDTYGRRIPGQLKDAPLYEPADLDLEEGEEGVEVPPIASGDAYRYPAHQVAIDRYNNLHSMGDNLTHVERREREALVAKFGAPSPKVVDNTAMAGGTQKMEDEDREREAAEQKKRDDEAKAAEEEEQRRQAEKKAEEDRAYAQREADEKRERELAEAQERESNEHVDQHGTD